MIKEEINEKVKKFFNKYPARDFAKGQIIVFEGDNPPGIMYMQEGAVSEYYISIKGEKMVINIFKQSAFSQISWALNKKPNDYFFEANSKTVLKVAPPDDVINFLNKNPDVTIDLLARVLNGIDGVLTRDIHLKKGTAKSLILNELVITGKRFGDKSNKKSVTVNLTAQELANRTGLSRETVSREIKKLSNDSLVRQSYGNLEIIDMKKLEQLTKI